MHLAQLFDWREWIEKLSNESIVESLVVLGKRRLRYDCGLVVRWRVIVLLFSGGSATASRSSISWRLDWHRWILELLLFLDLLGG